MQGGKLRVVLGSEYPEVRYFLRGMVEREEGVVIVGQAQDAVKALTLTRNLRPDVAIIDSYLPHVIGLDAIPLSRISGLDTAQAIVQEVPNVWAVVVNNLEVKLLPEYGLGPDVEAFFIKEGNGNAPFTLRELCQKTESLTPLVFAKVETKPRVAVSGKGNTISERAIFWGGLGIAGGWFLTLTVFLAPAGVPLTIAGALTLAFGLAGKLVALQQTKRAKAILGGKRVKP